MLEVTFMTDNAENIVVINEDGNQMQINISNDEIELLPNKDYNYKIRQRLLLKVIDKLTADACYKYLKEHKTFIPKSVRESIEQGYSEHYRPMLEYLDRDIWKTRPIWNDKYYGIKVIMNGNEFHYTRLNNE